MNRQNGGSPRLIIYQGTMNGSHHATEQDKESNQGKPGVGILHKFESIVSS